MHQAWQAYGRKQELEHLIAILPRRRFFFVRILGRRRIGKTTLAQEALRAVDRQKMLYLQIPDSDPAGVVSAALDFFAIFDIREPPLHDLRSLAACLASLIRAGYVVAVDEFQYFHRAALYEFTSHLQAEVDRFMAESSRITGGLIVLGSTHTEMSALLEDRSAPIPSSQGQTRPCLLFFCDDLDRTPISGPRSEKGFQLMRQGWDSECPMRHR